MESSVISFDIAKHYKRSFITPVMRPDIDGQFLQLDQDEVEQLEQEEEQ